LIDFIIPKKGQDLVDAYDDWSNRAARQAICDYSFHCAITYWDDKLVPTGMNRLINEKGISSFKLFLAYKGTFQVQDDEILKVLDCSKRLGALTMAHCEHADIVDYGQKRLMTAGVTGPEGHYWSRIDECEAEATHRMITLAHTVNSPLYVVHVMSALAADEVARGRRKGCVLFGETVGEQGVRTYPAHNTNRIWQPRL
jgi:dihydropyrimidinase